MLDGKVSRDMYGKELVDWDNLFPNYSEEEYPWYSSSETEDDYEEH